MRHDHYRVRLHDWRRRISLSAAGALGLCSTACGDMPSTEPRFPAVKTTAPLEAPLFRGASYYALITPRRGGYEPEPSLGPTVVAEKPGYQCGAATQERLRLMRDTEGLRERLVSLRAERDRVVEAHQGQGKPPPEAFLNELKRDIEALEGRLREQLNTGHHCPPELFDLIQAHKGRRGILLVDAEGKAAFHADSDLLVPIDAPWKAALVVWFAEHRPGDGLTSHARVTRSGAGFEVIVTRYEESPRSPGDDADPCRRTFFHETYEVRLRVDRQGRMTDVERRRVDVSQGSQDTCHTHGRRPEQFVDVEDTGTLRSHWARAMHHEAESVRAFERLAAELRFHGAPMVLVREAETAAQDERRHAAMYRALAARFGFDLPLRVQPNAGPIRELLEVARENAREGVGYESFASAMALHQAEHSATQELRTHYRAIAADELRHAALAHAVHEWAKPHLAPAGRQKVEEERERAWTHIGAAVESPSPVERWLGYPDAASQRTLALTMKAALNTAA